MKKITVLLLILVSLSLVASTSNLRRSVKRGVRNLGKGWIPNVRKYARITISKPEIYEKTGTYEQFFPSKSGRRLFEVKSSKTNSEIIPVATEEGKVSKTKTTTGRILRRFFRRRSFSRRRRAFFFRRRYRRNRSRRSYRSRRSRRRGMFGIFRRRRRSGRSGFHPRSRRNWLELRKRAMFSDVKALRFTKNGKFKKIFAKNHIRAGGSGYVVITAKMGYKKGNIYHVVAASIRASVQGKQQYTYRWFRRCRRVLFWRRCRNYKKAIKRGFKQYEIRRIVKAAEKKAALQLERSL